MEETKTQEDAPAKEKEPKKPREKKKLLFLVLLILLLLISGLVGWKYKSVVDDNRGLKKTEAELQLKVEDLTKQVAAKTKEADDAKAAAAVKTTATTTTTTTATVPTAALKQNVTDSITSKNTAALEGYMATSVNVVFAASEKAGPRTPTEAISDLAYISAATDPWNFALSAATLTTYKNGFYGQYFGTSTIVGKSANNYVISFHVNASNKIDVIFVSISDDLLK